jgi:toxin ParE1/3/4
LRLTWRPQAEADRDYIIDYTARDNPVAALELGDKIETQVAQLPQYPKLYRAGRVKGTREMIVHPNYIVVYRIRPGEIQIVRVLHAAQQWPESR